MIDGRSNPAIGIFTYSTVRGAESQIAFLGRMRAGRSALPLLSVVVQVGLSRAATVASATCRAVVKYI